MSEWSFGTFSALATPSPRDTTAHLLEPPRAEPGPGESGRRLELTPLAAPACCGPSARAALSPAEAERTAALLKAVADPVRLRIVSLVRTSPGCEACVCDLTAALGLAQATVSHHLKVLVGAGLLTRERRGTWAWYTLVPGRFEDLAAIFG